MWPIVVLRMLFVYIFSRSCVIPRRTVVVYWKMSTCSTAEQFTTCSISVPFDGVALSALAVELLRLASRLRPEDPFASDLCERVHASEGIGFPSEMESAPLPESFCLPCCQCVCFGVAMQTPPQKAHFWSLYGDMFMHSCSFFRVACVRSEVDGFSDCALNECFAVALLLCPGWMNTEVFLFLLLSAHSPLLDRLRSPGVKCCLIEPNAEYSRCLQAKPFNGLHRSFILIRSRWDGRTQKTVKHNPRDCPTWNYIFNAKYKRKENGMEEMWRNFFVIFTVSARVHRFGPPQWRRIHVMIGD